jgi:hypothetical protein
MSAIWTIEITLPDRRIRNACRFESDAAGPSAHEVSTCHRLLLDWAVKAIPEIPADFRDDWKFFSALRENTAGDWMEILGGMESCGIKITREQRADLAHLD